MNHQIQVSSEVGTLRRLLIHSPDSGVGKVIPSKAQDWLFEDIVHLDTMRRDEYDFYVKILLYFLDPEKVKGKLKEIDADQSRSFYKPDNPNYFKSDKVIDIQRLLADILGNDGLKTKLVASICAVERCSFQLQQDLMQFEPKELSKILISGMIDDDRMIFAPLPNLIFTRDIGITINNHILLNKPAKSARTRESLLAQYIFFHHPVFEKHKANLIEIPDNQHHFLLSEKEGNSEFHRSTLEGGDVMMVAPNHLLIGCSERTSVYAAQEVIKILFEKAVVEKITIVKIPKKRDYMHIDTVFTQIKRNMWVLLKSIARQGDDVDKQDILHYFTTKKNPEFLEIIQFERQKAGSPRHFQNLEDLLTEISQQDLGCSEPVEFVYSGNDKFPFGEREQWTDSCNLLALKEGVVIGYDRNDKTLEAFKNRGMRIIKAADLLEEFENGINSPETIRNTFIMLPSAELSRARGGSHCMSMPILRD
jgi:arginine deiminase